MPDTATPFTFTEIAAREPGKSFHEIAHIRDPDGLIAVFTERVEDGKISCAIFREFDKRENGHVTPQRTMFFASRHLSGYRRLLDEIERRIEGIEDRSRMARRIAEVRR